MFYFGKMIQEKISFSVFINARKAKIVCRNHDYLLISDEIMAGWNYHEIYLY